MKDNSPAGYSCTDGEGVVGSGVVNVDTEDVEASVVYDELVLPDVQEVSV